MLRDSIFGQLAASSAKTVPSRTMRRTSLRELEITKPRPAHEKGGKKDVESLDSTEGGENVDGTVGLRKTEDGLILVGWYSSGM